MRLNVSIKQKNDDYSQEYADEYEFGNESVNNQKYKWSVSFDYEKEIDEISILDNQELIILNPYQDNDDDEMKLLLKDMKVLKCLKNEIVIEEYCVSHKLIERYIDTSKDKKSKTYFNFYLKDRADYIEFGRNIYALKSDIKIIK